MNVYVCVCVLCSFYAQHAHHKSDLQKDLYFALYLCLSVSGRGEFEHLHHSMTVTCTR